MARHPSSDPRLARVYVERLCARFDYLQGRESAALAWRSLRGIAPAAAVATTVVLSACGGDDASTVREYEICSNGMDDDGNGLADCDDENCAISPDCRCDGGGGGSCSGLGGFGGYGGLGGIGGAVYTGGFGGTSYPADYEDCWDGYDNDSDGLVDCADPDCADDSACDPCQFWSGDQSCDACSRDSCLSECAGCLSSPECLNLTNCAMTCEDVACVDACASAHPDGVAPFDAFLGVLGCEEVHCWSECYLSFEPCQFPVFPLNSGPCNSCVTLACESACTKCSQSAMCVHFASCVLTCGDDAACQADCEAEFGKSEVAAQDLVACALAHCATQCAP